MLTGRESVLSHGPPQMLTLKPNSQGGLRGEAFGVGVGHVAGACERIAGRED